MTAISHPMSFKGSMKPPMYEHGPIEINGDQGTILQRQWLTGLEEWQYIVDIGSIGVFGIVLSELGITELQGARK